MSGHTGLDLMGRFSAVFELVKKNAAVVLIIAVLCVVYFYPYVVNHNFIVATAHSDDDFIVCNIVYNNIENFKNDMYFYLAPIFLRGTIMNWGSLFLVNKVGVPITLLSLFFQFVESFMLPFCYLYLIRKTIDKIWIPFVFLAALLSNHIAWNLSNHGMSDYLPYRGHIAISILFAGMLMIISGKKGGYLLTILGTLFHATTGVYAFVIIALWQILRNRRILSKDTLYLLPVLASVFIPAYSVLSLDHVPVSKQDILDLFRFSMHFYPWDSPYLWEQSVPAVSVLFLLTLFFRPYWGEFGVSYRQLVLATIGSTIILMITHVAGIVLGNSSLISLCGLHSPTMLAVIMLPVFIAGFSRILHVGNFVEQFFALFTLTIMIVGRPYGLFVFPTLMMVLYSVRKRSALIGPLAVLLGAVWFVAWAVLSKPPGNYFMDRTASVFSDILLKFVSPIVGDAAPSLSKMPITVTGISLFLLTICLIQSKTRLSSIKVYPVCLTLIACAFLVISSKQTLARTGSQSARDLYDAQIWAREHSEKSDTFIVWGGSWRAFSERSAFAPRSFGFYLYLPDSRFKAINDKVFHFFNIENPYQNFDQRSLARTNRERYLNLMEPDFYRLAAIAGAQYLVETRPFNLPLVYRNSTYYIYRLM